METHISPPLLIINFYSRKRERDFSLDFHGRKKKEEQRSTSFVGIAEAGEKNG